MILTLARRELQGLFLSPLAWVLLAVNQVLLAWAFLRVLEHFMGLEAGRRIAGLTLEVNLNLYSFAAILALFTTPLLTMRLFSEEYRNRTYPLLAAAPISARQVVLGKYLGLLGGLASLLALPLVLGLSLLLVSAPDAGLIAAATLGLALAMAAFGAIGLFLSALTSAPGVAAVATYGTLLLLSVVSQAGQVQAQTLSLFDWLSWNEHFLPFLFGQLRTTDLVYFLGIVTLFLLLTLRRLEQRRLPPHPQRLRRHLDRLASYGLLFAAVAMSSWLSTRHAWQWDWTANARNTLSAPSRQVLARLSGPLTMTSYAPADTRLRRRIRQFLERYRQARSDIQVLFVDPELHPEQARAAGIALTGELSIAYGGRRESLRILSEETVSNAVQRLLAAETHWIVALAGHGERAILGQANHDLARFAAELETKGLRIQSLDLATTPAIPGNTGLLLIASPQAPFLPGELKVLQRYLEQGGNLLWLLDPGAPGPLEPLARELGLEVLPGVIVDASAADLGIRDPAVALVPRYPAHAVTRHFDRLSLFPHAVALRVQPPIGWQAQPLLSTLQRSWNETGPLDGDIRADPEHDEHSGPLLLGVALTRALADAAGEHEQRVVLVGDGDFLSNSFLDNGGNRDLGLRLVRWLLDDETLLEIPPRVARDQALTLTRNDRLVLGIGSLFALPMLFLASGGLIWWRRNRH